MTKNQCFRKIKKLKNSPELASFLGDHSYRQYDCDTIDENSCKESSMILTNENMCYEIKSNKTLEPISPTHKWFIENSSADNE